MVLDERTRAPPDRLGINRVKSYENLAVEPSVALIVMISGHNARLRVAGEGRLRRDPARLEGFDVTGKPPRLALVVRGREAFPHGAASMVRAGPWRRETWPARSKPASLAEAMVAHFERTDGVDARQAVIDGDERLS